MICLNEATMVDARLPCLRQRFLHELQARGWLQGVEEITGFIFTDSVQDQYSNHCVLIPVRAGSIRVSDGWLWHRRPVSLFHPSFRKRQACQLCQAVKEGAFDRCTWQTPAIDGDFSSVRDTKHREHFMLSGA